MTGPNHFDPYRKAARVGLAIVLIVSVSGYFMGLRQTSTTPSSHDLAELVAHPVEDGAQPTAPAAPDYANMRDLPKANMDWVNTLGNLRQPVVDLFATNSVSDAERATAMDQRRKRRAYDGAPPVVPHPIPQISAASCLACHGEGKVIQGRVASKISHTHFSNCTQCHVPAEGSMREAMDQTHLTMALSGNEFDGLRSFGPGTRAYPGAPPTIPHPTFMRADCMSCHGPTGTASLRTSHPWRQSCTQCHVASAELDQHSVPPGHPLDTPRALQAFLLESPSR